VVYRQPANGANTNYQGPFEMVVYNTFPAVAGVFGVIFFLFIIILILKCCTEDRRPKVTRRRRLRSSYENLPRTSVPTTQHRPAPTSVEDITDIDGIVVVPEPGEGLLKFKVFLTIWSLYGVISDCLLNNQKGAWLFLLRKHVRCNLNILTTNQI
jgi:hypothetical protein